MVYADDTGELAFVPITGTGTADTALGLARESPAQEAAADRHPDRCGIMAGLCADCGGGCGRFAGPFAGAIGGSQRFYSKTRAIPPGLVASGGLRRWPWTIEEQSAPLPRSDRPCRSQTGGKIPSWQAGASTGEAGVRQIRSRR
jgi:hypothetical protein